MPRGAGLKQILIDSDGRSYQLQIDGLTADLAKAQETLESQVSHSL